MADAISLAKSLGISKVRLDAEHLGRYAWLRVGIIPDRGSWHRLEIELTHRLTKAITDIGIDRFQELLSVIRSPDPGAARELAMLRDPVRSAELFNGDGTPVLVPLGRALFLEIGSNWSGEFDVDDQASIELMQKYVGNAG